MPVHDNQFVKKGELLFEIDDRPYRYALENALVRAGCARSTELRTSNDGLRLHSRSAVSVAEANIHSAEADVADAEQGVDRARAEWAYASNNLQRLEPLLANHFVTVDDIDKANTVEIAQQEALRQAQSKLLSAQAVLNSARAQHEQAGNAVTTLDPLTSQRGARKAAVERARYDLDNCRVYAPFDARVTNLTISEGAYAHVGQQMFLSSLTRAGGGPWPTSVKGNSSTSGRECVLRSMSKLSQTDRQVFSGFVDSIGFPA